MVCPTSTFYLAHTHSLYICSSSFSFWPFFVPIAITITLWSQRHRQRVSGKPSFPPNYTFTSRMHTNPHFLFFHLLLLILHWFKHARHCNIVFLYVWLNGSAMDLCIGIFINYFCNIVGWYCFCLINAMMPFRILFFFAALVAGKLIEVR